MPRRSMTSRSRRFHMTSANSVAMFLFNRAISLLASDSMGQTRPGWPNHTARRWPHIIPRSQPRDRDRVAPRSRHDSLADQYLEVAAPRLELRSGSQVGSHSLWTAVDGCGRRWSRNPFVWGCVDGCGRAWTRRVDLRIRRLGVRVSPGVLREVPAQVGVSPRRRSAELVAGMRWERFLGAILNWSDDVAAEARPLLRAFACDRAGRPSDILGT